MREQTGCDAVMIGRGALGNPWIFAACRATLTNQPWSPPTPPQKWEVIEEHFQITLADKGERIGVREMRKHLGWYSKGLPGAAQFRARVFRLDDPREVLDTSREFFLKPQSHKPIVPPR
jgi:tRNA-dihydrouridine synthase